MYTSSLNKKIEQTHVIYIINSLVAFFCIVGFYVVEVAMKLARTFLFELEAIQLMQKNLFLTCSMQLEFSGPNEVNT